MKPLFNWHKPRELPARRPKDDRPSAAQRGYDHEWRRRRRKQLDREPYCEDCRERGQLVEATQVDHVKSKRRGGEDEQDNLRSLCASCHSRKTCKKDGGFGRRPGKG